MSRWVMVTPGPDLAAFTALPGAWLQRLGGIDNIARLLAAAEGPTDWRATIIEARTVQMGGAAAATFVDRLTDSFDHRLAVAVLRSRRTLRRLGFRSRAGFRLGEDPRLAAEIVAGRPRPWFWPGAPAPTGAVSQGAYCALDDLWATATCNADFLFERGATPPVAVPVVAFGEPGPRRYLDYAEALTCRDGGILAAFTCQAPLSPSRLALAATLSELSIDWILAHETAHELLGHFEFIGKHDGIALRFSDGAGALGQQFGLGASDEVDDSQALEMQADWLATVILISRLVTADADQTYPMAMYASLRDGEAGTPDVAQTTTRFRIGLVAALGAALCLELAPHDGSSHPAPSVRVLNILVCAHDLFELVALEGHPDADHAAVHTRLSDIVTAAALDLDLMARMAGLSAPAYRIGGPQDLVRGAPRLASDALMILSREAGVGALLATPAGRDYGRLRGRSLALWTDLDRRRLGRMAQAHPFAEALSAADAPLARPHG